MALKDAAASKILRTLVNKFGGSAHAVVLDGDLRRYPQVNNHVARCSIMICGCSEVFCFCACV